MTAEVERLGKAERLLIEIIDNQTAELERLREAMDAMSRAAVDGDLRAVVDTYLSTRAALGDAQ